MTTFNKNTLRALFEQGDIPTGQNYSDLIDSYVNVVETGVQNMAGPLSTTELITSRVSASNLVIGGTFFSLGVQSSITTSAGGSYNNATAGSYTVSAGGNIAQNAGSNINVNAGGSISVNSGNTINVSALGNINLNSQVLASALRVTTAVSANKVYAQDGHFSTPAIVSAAGTTQGAATIVSAPMSRLAGVTDGSATGFALMGNRAGLTQYLYNTTAASANLWPPTGGTINGLGANAAFALAATTPYIVMHLTASAYAVK